MTESHNNHRNNKTQKLTRLLGSKAQKLTSRSTATSPPAPGCIPGSFRKALGRSRLLGRDPGRMRSALSHTDTQILVSMSIPLPAQQSLCWQPFAADISQMLPAALPALSHYDNCYAISARDLKRRQGERSESFSGGCWQRLGTERPGSIARCKASPRQCPRTLQAPWAGAERQRAPLGTAARSLERVTAGFGGFLLPNKAVGVKNASDAAASWRDREKKKAEKKKTSPPKKKPKKTLRLFG